MQAYSQPDRESDATALPDIEIFRLTAHEVAAMVTEEGIEGGWYYWYCFPGCLPDSEAIGPFLSYRAALKAAQYEQQES